MPSAVSWSRSAPGKAASSGECVATMILTTSLEHLDHDRQQRQGVGPTVWICLAAIDRESGPVHRAASTPSAQPATAMDSLPAPAGFWPVPSSPRAGDASTDPPERRL